MLRRVMKFSQLQNVYLAALVLAVTLLLTLLVAAAASSVAFEAEDGSRSGNAAVVVDSNASKGQAISFTSTPPMSSTFLETFTNGNITSPQLFSSSRWDIRRNITNLNQFISGQSMEAEHGGDCAAPPAMHHIGNWLQEGVFICRDHLMTAANSNDTYGIIVMTPAAQIDFSTQGKVSWNQSTFEMSRRDWVDFWITPINDVMALSCNGKCPTYDGLSRNTINIEKDGLNFTITVMKDFQTIAHQSIYMGNLVPSATVRTLFEVILTPNSLIFRAPEINQSVTVNVQMPFTRGFVQWAHHSYNPTKDGSGVPATWHWDNFSLDPAVPAQFIKSTQERFVGNVGTTRTVTHTEPAPANSRLIFSGVCKIEINFGSGFVDMPQVPGTDPKGPEIPSSWNVSVPQGTTSYQVRFQGDGWYNGFPCLYEDPVFYAPEA